MERFIITMLLSLAAAGACAQETWTLERCIAYATEHNLDIREKELEADIRKAEYRGGRFGHLPALTLGLAQDFNWGRSVDMQELVIVRNKLTKATGASLTAGMTIFEGFTRQYDCLAAGKAAERASYDLLAGRRQLSIDVTRAYLELMLAGQMQSHTRDSYASIMEQHRRTVKLVEAGSQPKSALHEMTAQVAAEKAAMVSSDCQVRTSTLSLKLLMNLPDSVEFNASAPLADKYTFDRPVLIPEPSDEVISRDPRLGSARSSVSEMEYRLNSALGAFFPKLSLAVGYGTFYSSSAGEPFKTQLDENRNPSLSLRLDIPVFNAMQNHSRMKRRRLELEAARTGAENVRTRIAGEISSLAIEAENGAQKYRSAEETLAAMKELLSVTEAKYDLGAASALDYIVARNNHSKAVADYLQAKWQYLFQLLLMEYYRP